MFCEEEIKAVYYGYHYENSQDYPFDYYHFDYLHNMILYLSDGCRMILETDNYIISIFKNEVNKSIKTCPVYKMETEAETIDPCYLIDDETNEVIWIEYEDTLFKGERLISVEKDENLINLVFDDFKVGVMSYDELDTNKTCSVRDDINVLGAERLITRKCSCGGTGKLLLDFVNDYGVQCDKCHLGTWDTMWACDAIKEWNENDGVHDRGESGEESFFKNCKNPIDRICIRNDFLMYDSNLLDCESLIVDMKSHIFMISVKYLHDDVFDFSFKKLSDYNPEMWSRKIIATDDEPIRFVCKKNDEYGGLLYFKIGERPLLISTDDMLITVGLSGFDENGNKVDYDNDKMFNDM